MIYRGTDGTLVVRLRDFSVTNRPDLHALISGHQSPAANPTFVKSRGYTELGKLKGNQNYIIPTDVKPDATQSIVIYCKPFKVVFAVAGLDEVGG